MELAEMFVYGLATYSESIFNISKPIERYQFLASIDRAFEIKCLNFSDENVDDRLNYFAIAATRWIVDMYK